MLLSIVLLAITHVELFTICHLRKRHTKFLAIYLATCSHSMNLLVNGCVRFESKNKKTFYAIPPTIFKNS